MMWIHLIFILSISFIIHTTKAGDYYGVDSPSSQTVCFYYYFHMIYCKGSYYKSLRYEGGLICMD